MRYLGGKSRAATFLLPLIVGHARSLYVEPFVGGGSVLAAAAPHFDAVQAGDVHPPLISLWNAVLSGWEPPELVSEEDYARLRLDLEPSPEQGYAGFACSFGGKWFGGFARKSDGTPDQSSSRASLLRKAADIRPHVPTLQCASFNQYDPGPDSVVYCDPPYVTSAAYTTQTWRPYDFWDTVRGWVANEALVVVSEFQAPRDFVLLAETDRAVSVERTSSVRSRAAERVFVHETQRDAFAVAGAA